MCREAELEECLIGRVFTGQIKCEREILGAGLRSLKEMVEQSKGHECR